MLDQQLPYCPCCASPLPSAEPGRCECCGEPFAEPHMASIHSMVSLPRKPCQSCFRSIPRFATICARCRVHQDPVRPAPQDLPAAIQAGLDHRSYEDNYLYVVLPAGTAPPEPDAVMAAILATDLEIRDVAEAEYNRGHRPRWERRLFAQDPERPRQSWESSAEGIKPRTGERVHIWLEETGLPQDMGLVPEALSEAEQVFIRESAWSVGLHCDTPETPSWNTRLMMRLVRCILPESAPLVIEAATGRILPEVWREAAEINPPPLHECYAVRQVERDGVAWLSTRGLPRWGCFELEIVGVPAERAADARQIIDAVAGAMVPLAELPPPWTPLFFPNGAGFAWVPYEHIADRLPRDAPGTRPEERRWLRHATVVVVSPHFGRAIFEEIQAHPAAGADPAAAADVAAAPPPAPAPTPKAAPAAAAPTTAPRASSLPVLVPPPTLADLEGPSPLLAALASLVLPGAGQVWLGQPRKGTAMLIVSLLLCGGAGILNLLAAADAWVLARRQQAQGRALEAWEFFWS